eukprot:2969692-Pyramimonas_sp.AAC.1
MDRFQMPPDSGHARGARHAQKLVWRPVEAGCRCRSGPFPSPRGSSSPRGCSRLRRARGWYLASGGHLVPDAFHVSHGGPAIM